MKVTAGVGLAIVSVTTFALVGGSSAEAAGPVWQVIKTFDTPSDATVTAVKAFGPNNVWVFTARQPVERLYPNAYHWNGKSWRKTTLPKKLSGHVTSVDGTSGSDVWANVTVDNDADGLHGILHWNGKSWSLVKKLTSGAAGSPAGVTVLRRNDVWAFNVVNSGTDVLHFNGRTWSRRTARNLALYSPVVISSSNVWARGYSLKTEKEGYYHFNGRSWTRKSPSVPRLGVRSCDSYPVRRPCGDVLVGEPVKTGKTGVVISLGVHREDGSGKVTNATRLLRWTGKKWTLSGRTWPWLVAKLTDDRKGGYWFEGRNGPTYTDTRQDQVVVHQRKNGKRTVSPLAAQIEAISAEPSGSLFAIGVLHEDRHVWRLRP